MQISTEFTNVLSTKTPIIFILLATLMTNIAISTHTYAKAKSQLEDYRYQHRIIITRLDSDEALDALQQDITKYWVQFEQRKLAIFVLMAQDTLVVRITKHGQTRAIIDAKEAHKRLQKKHTLLIGLDGGDKSVYENFSHQQIFADIDAMPMRQAESGFKP
jgi:phage tail sheath gpL-like